MDGLQLYIDELASETAKLPEFRIWEKHALTVLHHLPQSLVSEYLPALYKMLTYLEARDIKQFNLSEYSCSTTFKPVRSIYFRRGEILSNENMTVDEHLTAKIIIGFGDSIYDPGDKPDIYLEFRNKTGAEELEVSERYPFHSYEFIEVLNEIFDIFNMDRYTRLTDFGDCGDLKSEPINSPQPNENENITQKIQSDAQEPSPDLKNREIDRGVPVYV